LDLQSFFGVWKKVFSKPWYVVLSVAIALIFYLGNIFIINHNNIILFYHLFGLGIVSSLPSLLLAKGLILTSSLVTLILISILFGILFSLILYKAKMIKSVSGKTGIVASIGIFLGVIGPGCAACGLGLLPVLGISSAFLIALPLHGLEISILSVGILAIVTFKITKDIDKGISCNIEN